MPTCPDCGSLIMEGDSYCTHCGAHLKWGEDIVPPQMEGDELDDMLNSLFIDNERRMILKAKIESYLKARDCTRLLLRESHGSYIFTFTRENEYVKTSDEFEYDPNYINPTRVFRECYPNHDHTLLIENPEFQKLIRSIGLEFIDCRGGYKTEYTVCPDEFQLKDEIEIYVRFRLGQDKVRVYDLDLDKMKLSDEYHDW